jgi:hypothetical protein
MNGKQLLASTLTVAMVGVVGCDDTMPLPDASTGGATTAAMASQRDWAPADCDALKPAMQRALFRYFTDASPVRCSDCGAAARVVVGGDAPNAYSSDVFISDAMGSELREFTQETRTTEGYVFAIAGTELIISAESSAGERAELARVSIANGAARLALDPTGRRLVLVASRVSSRSAALDFGGALPQTAERRAVDPVAVVPRVELLYLDVADPLQPSLVRKVSLQGRLLAAARSRNGVTLVVRRGWSLKGALLADADFARAVDAYESALAAGGSTQSAAEDMRARIEAAVDRATIADLTPVVIDVDHAAPRMQPLLACPDVAVPAAEVTVPETVAVLTFDWNGDPVDHAAVLDGATCAHIGGNRIELSRPTSTKAPLSDAETISYSFVVAPQEVRYLGGGVSEPIATSRR